MPGLSAARNGAWCGRMPSSPSVVTAMTSSALPSKTTSVGVTRLNGNELATSHTFGVFAHFVDRTGVEERALGQIVDLAFEDFFERCDRLGELDVFAGPPGELLGDEKRLREEALDAPRSRDGDLVIL